MLPFPVFVLTSEAELPREGTYYVLARDGLYLHKDTGLIRATVKVPQVSFLSSMIPTVEFLLPPLPATLTIQMIEFFRAVHRLYATEAALLIHYCVGTRQFRLLCPEQFVSAASVQFSEAARLPDYQLVGSAHSHAGMRAYHSSIDQHDEQCFDGLHVTVGRLDEPQYVDLSAQVVVNGNRFPVDPCQVLDGLTAVVIPAIGPVRCWTGKAAMSLGLQPHGEGGTCPAEEVSEIRYAPHHASSVGDLFPIDWIGRVTKKNTRFVGRGLVVDKKEALP